jgi:hypothetical protein
MNELQKIAVSNFDFCLDVFEYFTRKITYKNKNWYIKVNERDKKTLTKCLTSFADKDFVVGHNFIFIFLTFQFSWLSITWETGVENYNNGEIDIQKVFGKKAIERWFKRDISFDDLIFSQYCLEKFKPLSLQDFYKRYINHKKNDQQDENYSSISKHRILFKSQENYLGCIRITGGFDSKDVNCIICHFKKECVEITK